MPPSGVHFGNLRHLHLSCITCSNVLSALVCEYERDLFPSLVYLALTECQGFEKMNPSENNNKATISMDISAFVERTTTGKNMLVARNHRRLPPLISKRQGLQRSGCNHHSVLEVLELRSCPGLNGEFLMALLKARCRLKGAGLRVLRYVC